jgi:hypothetical protein
MCRCAVENGSPQGDALRVLIIFGARCGGVSPYKHAVRAPHLNDVAPPLANSSCVPAARCRGPVRRALAHRGGVPPLSATVGSPVDTSMLQRCAQCRAPAGPHRTSQPRAIECASGSPPARASRQHAVSFPCWRLRVRPPRPARHANRSLCTSQSPPARTLARGSDTKRGCRFAALKRVKTR